MEYDDCAWERASQDTRRDFIGCLTERIEPPY